MPSLMETIRHALGLKPPTPPTMTKEQSAVAERQRRIRQRQTAIDLQVEVLRADRADERRGQMR